MLRVYTTFINSTNHTFNLLHNFPQILFFSTSSSSFSSCSRNKFTEYLVNSLGFSQQQAVTTSTKLSTYKKVNYSNLSKNADSVVNLLKDEGFNDTHITKMVYLYPKLLTCRAHRTIKPKLKALIDEGISGVDLIDIVTVRPRMLGCSSASLVVPVIKILKEILVFDVHVIVVMKKLLFRSYYSVVNYLSLNVAFLTSCGVSIESIRRHFVHQPATFLRDPVVFKDVVSKVEKKLGNPPNSAMFLYGVHLFMLYSEEDIESRCRVFKSFGWTQTDVDMLMVKNARCFTLSDENIKKKLEFLMNGIGLEPAYLASNSCFFTCSLEKRVLPRHAVLQVLKEKGLMVKCPRLISVLGMSDSRFMKMFVMPFKEVHQVYADHIGGIVKSLTQQ